MLCILISGKIGSGKTTLAKALCKNFQQQGLFVIERTFADELKMQCASELNIPIELFYSQEGKNTLLNNNSLGTYLQIIATREREKDQDHWVKKLIENLPPISIDILIISDLRYKNELNYLQQHNYSQFIIRLQGDPGKVRQNSNRNLEHISEIDLDDYTKFDLIINTDEITIDDSVNKINCAVFEQHNCDR